MHIDGEGNSPKNGSNLAGKCPPPPQAAGQPTLSDGSTSNGTSALNLTPEEKRDLVAFMRVL
jgi:hypothetical protein